MKRLLLILLLPMVVLGCTKTADQQQSSPSQPSSQTSPAKAP